MLLSMRIIDTTIPRRKMIYEMVPAGTIFFKKDMKRHEKL